MSLYSAHSHYGQPPYSHYSQPVAHSGYHYQYQQPPPPVPLAPIYLDPVSFRREYTSRLAELNVNSRPIIQNLSMLAQDYSRYAEIVAQCLEGHIRRVSPCSQLHRCSSPAAAMIVGGVLHIIHTMCCPLVMYCSPSSTLSTKTSKTARRLGKSSEIDPLLAIPCTFA